MFGLPPTQPVKVLTVRKIKETYDMRKTKVVHIRPRYDDLIYKGLLFEIIE